MPGIDSRAASCWHASMSDRMQLQRDTAYKLLLDLIVSGKLSADEAISERQFAIDNGFGRTPVREAMRALDRDGLLEIIPARGTFVRRLDVAQLQELFEVRQLFEVRAAELAARNPDKSIMAACREMLEASREQADRNVPHVYKAGASFHVEVCRASGNTILFETYMPIRNRFRAAIGLAQHYDPEWVVCGIDQHLEILDAIERSKPALAGRLMSKHLDLSHESKKKILESRETRATTDELLRSLAPCELGAAVKPPH